MKYSCLPQIWLCIIVVATSSLCRAQTSAQITGRVTDASDAVVANVVITVENVGRGTKYTTLSNDAGYYTVTRLDPGTYRISVDQEGFRPITRSGVTLDVNQSARIDFVLEVGAVTQRIDVVGENPLLEASTAQLGTVVSEEKISDLPLNARNFTQLLMLTPGVSPINISQGGQTQRVGIRLQPSINGQSNRSNSFTLDGVYNNAHYVGTYAVAPSIDALSQFKVQSHSDQAEFGGVTGGVVNIATKSGTNEFHGTLFEFLRNDKLDARNFFAATKPSLRQNQFGAALGGPVVRNKTFFFFSYEGYRQVNATNILSLIPTPEELNGDFSATSRRIYDPYTTRTDPQNPNRFLRDLFPNNRIPASLINPSTRAYAEAIIPKPMATGVSGFNFRNTEPQTLPADNYSLRLDHYLSPRDSLWFRYSWGSQQVTNRQAFPGTLSLNDIPTRNLGASYTHTFGANTIFSGLFGYSSSVLTVNPFLTPRDLIGEGFFRGIPKDPRAHAPGINVAGFFSTTVRDQINGPQKGWQGRGDFTHTVGSHTFKFGGEGVRQPWATKEITETINFNARQTADLGNLGTSGWALASFVLGVHERIELSNSDYGIESQLWNAYLQDTWKATSRLTLNLGLRWDLLRQPNFYRDFQSTWDFNTGRFLVGMNQPPVCGPSQGPPCLQNPNHPYVQQWVVFTGSSQLRKNDYRMFGPRLGLAYRLRPTTVIRAAGSIFYDLMAGVNQQAQNGAVNNANWPGTRGVTSFPNVNFVNVTTNAPFGDTNPLQPAPTPAQINAFFYDPNFQNPYSAQWTMEIQKELTGNLTMSAAYVGSRNIRLSVGSDYNTALTPGPGPDRPRALWPHAPVTNWDRSVGRSSYHALQLKVERRFAQGLSYIGAYTWSKSIDIASSSQYRESVSLQNPYDPNSSKSVSGFDVPHLFSFALIYELPFGAGRSWLNTGLASRVLGNWQFNVIALSRSGQPFTPFMNVDVANIGAISQQSRARPDLLGNPRRQDPRPEAWFERAAFASPRQFTFGSAGRNILRSDALQNFDLSLFREESIAERFTLQFRVEAFNTFNHPTFGVPQNTFTNPLFGRVSGLAANTGARQVQLGLKIIF